MTYILALDQGTTGSTAAFFDARSLALITTTKVEFSQIYPRPGWVEHEPFAIVESMRAALKESWAKLRAQRPHAQLVEIQGIGVTNQRETIVAWNRKTGALAGNAIVWQDRRTATFCEGLKNDPALKEMILQRTGLVCDPYFSASKIKWMSENYPKVREWEGSGDLAYGTIDSYLIYLLTGGVSFVTEDTNASRTMLYNLDTGRYDAELCKLFGVKESSLPTILPSVGKFGVTKGFLGLPDGIPISGCLGDQQAALFGHDSLHEGEGKITYGTGAFLLINTGSKKVLSREGLLTTVAFSQGKERRFALEGSAFIAGAAVQFIRDNFKWIKSASEIEPLALSEPRDPSVLFVPGLAGLGAPYWNAHAKGVLFGLSRGTSQSQIARAVLESIALQNVQLLALMEKCSGISIKKLGVDGGAAKSDMLMQFQADVSRVSLSRPSSIEMTSTGAAKAALLGLKGEDAVESAEVPYTFTPTMLREDALKITSQWDCAAQCVNNFYRS